jgi:hypothetical protein
MRLAWLVLALGCGGAQAEVRCPECPARRAAPALEGAEALESVRWIAGRFLCELENETIEEAWTPPGGASMLGVNRTIRGGRTVAFELVRIEAREDGIVYVAHPALRNPGTEFRLRDVGAAANGRAIFENPEHDFPKVIVYERTEAGMDVRIEGDGAATGWVFRRVHAE